MGFNSAFKGLRSRLATGCTVHGSNPGGSEIFPTRPDRSRRPSILLYNRQRVSFTGVKRPRSGVDHQLPYSAQVKEKVELYLYSPSGPSCPVTGRILSLRGISMLKPRSLISD